MWTVLAQAVQETTFEEVKQGWASLVFAAGFFLFLVIAGIWWIQRA